MPRSQLHHDLLAGPPPEVLAEVDAAWERAQDLFADELELSFDVDPSGRVTGSLRLPAGGAVWERVSALEALAIACGDAEIMPGGGSAHADRALAA